jgi:hypothetical protein
MLFCVGGDADLSGETWSENEAFLQAIEGAVTSGPEL